jgi:3(or 17)beta-hydroxysteroid dehydrogenase
MNRLANKVAFVTGASAGIGRAAVLAMAREGAHIVATDIDIEGVESVAAEIRPLGVRALALKHDAGDETDWQAAIDTTLREFGRLDVLVNNAGIGPTRSLLETSLADWHAVMRINLDGVFLGTRMGVEAMRPLPARPRDSLGSIINLSSVLGLVGLPEAAAYSASKGAVRLLTKAVALECAAKGWDPWLAWRPRQVSTLKRNAINLLTCTRWEG